MPASAEPARLPPSGHRFHDGPDPHPGRARRIRQAHPEVGALTGRSPLTAVIGAALVLLQLGMAAGLAAARAPWWVVVAAAWLVGAFVAHALYGVIHEACHRLVFRSQPASRLLMLLCNLPLGLPFAIALGHYHRVHHRRQGQLGRDPDLPSSWEVRWVGSSRPRRWLWHLAFPFLQLGRVQLDPRDALSPADPWVLANAGVQLLATLLIGWLAGPTALAYLGLSLYFIFALHPLAGRFVQEHFVLGPGQSETGSYTGWLNRVALNLGHHVEHHDFPAVPWHRLPRLRAMAPEAYEAPAASTHTSWTRLWLRFLFDPDLRLDDRVVRLPDGPTGIWTGPDPFPVDPAEGLSTARR